MGYQDHKQTIHYSNRAGVRVIGSDCRDLGQKVALKIQASGEIYGKIIGTIDTPMRLEAKRLRLAGSAWKGRSLHRLPQGHRVPRAQGNEERI